MNFRKENNKLFTICSMIVITLFGGLSSCKKCDDPQNPDCSNYDPCYGKEIPSAKFLMNEGFMKNMEMQVFSDTVLLGFSVWFESELEDPTIEHRWYVGREQFDGRVTPSRRFDDPSIVRPTTIDITHVIEYEPNTCCYPNDDGYDSVIQTMHLVEYFDELKTYGKFYGAFLGTTDSFLMEFQALNKAGEKANVYDWYENLFVNFHNLGDSVYNYTRPPKKPFPHYGWVSMLAYNREARFNRDTDGTFRVFPNNRFLMEYTVPLKLDSTEKKFIVEGRKLQ
jgi:uncharacterized protein (DUF952 family)